MKVKIIFDKESLKESYFSGWGVSYLIGDKVLFDASEKGEYLLKNFASLNVDIEKIEKVVISHKHWDHHSGLRDLLEANSRIEVFASSDFLGEHQKEFSGNNFKLVGESQLIAENIYTTGCLSAQYKGSTIEEQAVVIKGRKGISLICGCAHPGVLKFIEKTMTMFSKERLYAVLGGFHLMDEEKRTVNYIVEEVKNFGVENIGPAHCSGFEAVNTFKQLYRENFLEVKVGQEFEL
ncbi:MAG: MBL fold metallo-hydrolase [Candidatus Omnitrophica bacterium]|nr:MBL fold metallo-hydrolase [Candidatus Omnitrophota bacterium]MBU2043713.1 MBL fold metallo-hydrolase [Candidatus Omnitrophota bacterium]MBU2250896.1 MBL fold metallo-hydrolase [Candidatus Omnitrophota bacterium]MBU2265997.1 MBL fold metallo-hydrolase [Candidatus Omnitrophota bacterium]MBU2474023.1 MBL fold metallo-hydrolase [Candidatus Omnitrophota bacterium]